MDNGLVQFEVQVIRGWTIVLILIVVDNGLVLWLLHEEGQGGARLNPYCSGQWSSTHPNGFLGCFKTVLILIVVDNGLVHY